MTRPDTGYEGDLGHGLERSGSPSTTLRSTNQIDIPSLPTDRCLVIYVHTNHITPPSHAGNSATGVKSLFSLCLPPSETPALSPDTRLPSSSLRILHGLAAFPSASDKGSPPASGIFGSVDVSEKRFSDTALGDRRIPLRRRKNKITSAAMRMSTPTVTPTAMAIFVPDAMPELACGS